MTIHFDPTDLAALVDATVERTIAAMQRLGPIDGRLAYTEAEAAEAIGLKKYQLRDARLRGELRGVRVGKTIVIERGELARFLTRGNGNGKR